MRTNLEIRLGVNNKPKSESRDRRCGWFRRRTLDFYIITALVVWAAVMLALVVLAT